MPRLNSRSKHARAVLAKIPAWLICLEGPKPILPIPVRIGALGRHGIELFVDALPLPPEKTSVQVALGGPPPLRYLSGAVTHAVAEGPGPHLLWVQDSWPLNPSAFKKLVDELRLAK